MSLSARRAWIEICLVDMSAAWNRSLSARRAWIEIHTRAPSQRPCRVALRKESVDRNRTTLGGSGVGSCRSPQGERG